MSTSKIMRAYRAAWNEGDEGERRKSLEEPWSDDGEYRDPTAGATILEGVDFGALAADGRVAAIDGFFGPLPELSA